MIRRAQGRKPLQARLVSEAGWYLLADVLQQACGLAVVPMLLFFLTPDEFGRITWALMAVQVAASVGSLGLDFALLRLYHRWREEDRGRLSAGVGVVTGAWSAMSALLALVMLALTEPPAALASTIILGWSAGLLLAIRAVPISLIRLHGRVGMYVAFVVVGSVLQALAQVVLVWAGFGSVGYMLGYAAGLAVSTLLAVILTREYFEWREAAWQLSPEIRAYTARVLPSVLFNRVLSLSDRLVLGVATDLTTLGVYGVAARFALPLKMVTGGFKMALMPLLSRGEAQGDGGVLFEGSAKLIMKTVLAGGIFVALVGWLVPLTPWREYGVQFQRLLLMLVAAQVLGALAALGQMNLYYSRRPELVNYVTGAGAAGLVMALLLLVPRFNAFGAAAAEVISSALSVAIVIHLALRLNRQAGVWIALMLWLGSFVGVLAGVWWLGRLGQALLLLAAGGVYSVAVVRGLANVRGFLRVAPAEQ